TTRTSRSRQSSSACQAGDGELATPPVLTQQSGAESATSARSRLRAQGIERKPTRRRRRSPYPHWFYLPAAIVFVGIFVIPTAMAFFYSFTRWTLFDWHFIG